MYARRSYYVAYGVSAAFHLIHGMLLSLGVFGVRLPRWAMEGKSKPFWTSFVAFAFLIVFGVFALGGNLFTPNTDRFPELKAFYEKKFVITSYSIHYTKLYDTLPTRP